MDTKTLLLIGAAFVGYKLLTKKKADKESSIWDALANIEFEPGQFPNTEEFPYSKPGNDFIPPDTFIEYKA